MKKLRFLTSVRFWSYVATAACAFGLGMLVQAKYFAPKNGTISSNVKEQIAKHSLSNKDNLDEAYKSALKRVDTGLERKDINQAQADKLKAKIKEIYEFRKKINATSKEGQAELRTKRTEWRKWLDDNKLSLKYIITLYWN